MDLVDPKMKRKPLFIHLDMSLTGDKTGIGGVWQKGKLPPREGEDPSKEMYYQLAFVVSIKAPKGHQVSFEKTRNFIYWLKKQGFNIKGISSDTYARAGVEQDLMSKGFNYSIISVDRVNSDHVCEPYEYFKKTIYEQKILLPRFGINLLTEELVGLERNNNTGKVDHSPSGINSKDSADAICGALYNASQHAEEYALDYGDSYDIMTEFNQEFDLNDYNEDFLNGMKEQFAPKLDKPTTFGYNQENYYGILDGVLVW